MASQIVLTVIVAGIGLMALTRAKDFLDYVAVAVGVMAFTALIWMGG